MARESETKGVTKREAQDEPGKQGGARLEPQSFHLSSGNNIGFSRQEGGGGAPSWGSDKPKHRKAGTLPARSHGRGLGANGRQSVALGTELGSNPSSATSYLSDLE